MNIQLNYKIIAETGCDVVKAKLPVKRRTYEVDHSSHIITECYRAA